jgi:hypothetical protein
VQSGRGKATVKQCPRKPCGPRSLAAGELMGRHVGAIARQLSFEEIMELVSGPNGESVFASEDDREAAWWHHREDLMEMGARGEPGNRKWGYWKYDLDVDQPTRLERVLLLEERGLLTAEERDRIASDAEHARKRERNPYVGTTPKEAAESIERSTREREDEQIEIAEALERCI